MNMHCLYTWQLVLDKIPSSIYNADILLIKIFLAQAAICLHPDTYMGVKLDPKLSPNAYIHFKPHGGWPMGGAPHSDFARPEIAPAMAQSHECIPIEVHANCPAPLPTTQFMTAKHHHSTTPKYLQAPADQLDRPFFLGMWHQALHLH
jgi:hypothetical protein